MVDSPEIAAEIVEALNAWQNGTLPGELPAGAVWVEPGRSFAMNASSGPLRCPAETADDGHVHRCSWPSRGRHVHHCACGADWMDAEEPESGRERSPEPADVQAITWTEFDRIEAKLRSEAQRFGLCGRCTTRTPLDRYGRLIAHRRELVLGQPEVCPGTGEMTL
jgi:hypothetical protein